MRKTVTIILFQLIIVAGLFAQDTNEAEVLTNLLDEFLEGASMNDPAIHDRFWAEDLIYTSSNGERVTKQDIMDGLDSDSESTGPVYHAEEIQIRLYDDMAVVAFKLVANSQSPNGTERMEFYNTGTFQKREGQWKAVAWQATRIPG